MPDELSEQLRQLIAARVQQGERQLREQLEADRAQVQADREQLQADRERFEAECAEREAAHERRQEELEEEFANRQEAQELDAKQVEDFLTEHADWRMREVEKTEAECRQRRQACAQEMAALRRRCEAECVERVAHAQRVYAERVAEAEECSAERLAELDERAALLAKEAQAARRYSVPEPVRFNVGGRTFDTTKATLARVPGSLLAACANGHVTQAGRDANGAFFFDRDPRYFDVILQYCRSGRQWPPQFMPPDVDMEQLGVELEFYGIKPELTGGRTAHEGGVSGGQLPESGVSSVPQPVPAPIGGRGRGAPVADRGIGRGRGGVRAPAAAAPGDGPA